MNAALVLALCVGSASPTVDEEAKKLQDVRQQLDQRRAAIKDLDDEQRSLVDSMGELDESLAALSEQSEQAKKKLDALQAELAVLEKKTAADEHALGSARSRLEARLRELYVGGEGGVARALLGAEGFEELALRRRFLQQLTKNDGRLVDDVEHTAERVRAGRERLRQATEEAAFTTKEIEEQKALIEATRADRQAAIDKIRSEKDLAARQAHELETEQQQVALLMTRLVEDAHRRALYTPLKHRGILRHGKLPWPVEGRLIRRFGVVVDKDSGAEIVSNGIEIRADAGTPVQAVADGRVVYVGWMRGFGRVVIVDHGDGHHTISAHLQKATVAQGDEVKRGQTLGLVGDTESMNGPKLYFELRENGRPKDPAPYLR